MIPSDPTPADARYLRTGVVLLAVVVVTVCWAGGSVAAAEQVNATDLPGSGTQQDPYVITNATELQAIADDRSAHYVLGGDVDASNTSSWNGGKGFDPIGENVSASFSGTFDGRGYVIEGLTIDRPSLSGVGLFGENGGVVENVTLVDANVTGNNDVGALVGHSYEGTVRGPPRPGPSRGPPTSAVSSGRTPTAGRSIGHTRR